MRRSLLTIAAVVALTGCAAPGSASPASLTPSSATPTAVASLPAVEPTPGPTAVPSVAVEATPPPAAFIDIALSGKGKKVEKFTIPSAEPAIAVITHTGMGKFMVDALDASGATIYPLVNVTGDYAGTVLFEFGEEGHSVAFAVDTDGTWTINIKPVTEAPVWDPTMTLTGTGDNVYQIVPVSSGLVILDLAYEGNDAFKVHAYSPDGREGLADEKGTFSGKVGMSDGSRLIDIDADTGTWSITPG